MPSHTILHTKRSCFSWKIHISNFTSPPPHSVSDGGKESSWKSTISMLQNGFQKIREWDLPTSFWRTIDNANFQLGVKKNFLELLSAIWGLVYHLCRQEQEEKTELLNKVCMIQPHYMIQPQLEGVQKSKIGSNWLSNANSHSSLPEYGLKWVPKCGVSWTFM